MPNKSVVDVSPTKKFFIDSITRDISIEDAIKDLIDNAIDGAKRYAEKGDYTGNNIKIYFDKKTFIIEDNCGGIPIEDAKNYVFRFGNNDDNLKNYSSSGFGIGMKRAFFKIGKIVDVQSTTKESRFGVRLNVNKWMKEEAWEIVVESKEMKADQSVGTKIKITKLNKGISNKFENKNFELKLRKLISNEYRDYINKGLKIEIKQMVMNKKNINEKEIYFENYKLNDMDVDIYIKKGESSIDESGWYIKLNEKFVVSADKTKLIGWNEGTIDELDGEEYSTDFLKFRGYVYATASNPLSLPLKTTKEGIDTDSEKYQFILNKMIEGVKKSRDKFKENNIVNVHYKKPRDEVERLEEHFKVKSATKVGIKTYDAYLESIKK